MIIKTKRKLRRQNAVKILIPGLLTSLAGSAVANAAETTFEYGGYIKLDAIFSQYSDGQRANASVGDDFLVPSVIPVGDGDNKGDTVFDSNAKFSRINFKTITDTSVGAITGFVEMDFNAGNDERLTNQSSGGLRHAFFKWKQQDGDELLAGQTWSTFFNVGALPEAVDFVGPTSGSIFIRQTQLRYTTSVGENSKLMIAAENPSVSLYDGGGGIDDNAMDDSSIPDLVIRNDMKAGDLSFSAAAMLRQIGYRDVANDVDDSQVGYGVSLSGKYLFGNGDDLKFMASHGNLGRYIALNAFRDGVVEADGDVELITASGGFIAYRHLWSDQWRSTLSYAYGTADNPDTLVADATKTISNANLNLLYSPTPGLTFGAEYLIASRETESGADGDLNRLQFTSKWAF